MLCYMETVSMCSHHPTCICKLRTRAMLTTQQQTKHGAVATDLVQCMRSDVCYKIFSLSDLARISRPGPPVVKRQPA